MKLHRGSVTLFLLTFLLPLCIPLFAADKKLQEQVNVDLINVYLTATDKKGNFIDDLKPEELLIKEDGKQQEITNFSKITSEDSTISLTVAFLIDTSGSMEAHFPVASRAANTVLQQLRPQDRMQLFAFDQTLRQLTPFTTNEPEVEQALAQLKAQNAATAIYDSTCEAAEKIRDQQGRQIIVLITDGEDNKSLKSSDETARLLNSMNITVLAIGLWSWRPAFGGFGMGGNDSPRRGDLNFIAENTGGYVFFPESATQADEMLNKLRSAITNQYFLAYRTPTISKNETRKIEISCKRKGVKLRYRRSYSAAPEEPETETPPSGG
ncbi:MAG: hypothetical protein C5B54_01835 [Acidobacteria bacterium]|nr:MAG: hypothetical protein C5B54_01835 [Acidobacteriota bacterium]